MPILNCISSFEGSSYKRLQDIATSSFFSCYFTITSAFTSADIFFLRLVLELHSTLSEKRFLS